MEAFIRRSHEKSSFQFPQALGKKCNLGLLSIKYEKFSENILSLRLYMSIFIFYLFNPKRGIIIPERGIIKTPKLF